MVFPSASMRIKKCHRRWWIQESSSHLEMGPVGMQGQLHHAATSDCDVYLSSPSREIKAQEGRAGCHPDLSLLYSWVMTGICTERGLQKGSQCQEYRLMAAQSCTGNRDWRD